MTTIEAAAVVALRSLMFCKAQIARRFAFNNLQGRPELDWLLEQGFVTVRGSNRTVQFAGGEPTAYVTKTGKAWFHQPWLGGAGIAMLVLARRF